MESSPPPTATPPSRLSKVSTLCLVQPEDRHGEDNREDASPLLSHKKRQLQFLPQSPLPESLPLRELILISPTRRRRPRAMATENIDPDAQPRGRSKSKGRSLGCASPRNARRPREKSEKEFVFLEEEIARVRRKKKKKQDKNADEGFSLATVAAPTTPDPNGTRCPENVGRGGVLEFVNELVLWKDVARSSLWFGFGSLCILSSCFSRNFNFNPVSAGSQVGLFLLALAFFRDALFSKRLGEQRLPRYTLKEEDALRAIQLILPMANAAIEVVQEVFSGEPLMTLKVAPILLFVAKYSHLITLWRFLAIGFFISFTVPRFFSCYSQMIQKHVEIINLRATEAWAACQHKRFITLSCVTIFWNMFGVKARIIAAFLAVVIFRYHQHQSFVEEGIDREVEEEVMGKEKYEDLSVIEDGEIKKEA